MTVVHLDTGEIVEALTFDEALELTESIRESVDDLEEKVIEAYRGRVWLSMDYESWDDYVQGEFKRAPLALPREERQTQVASLRSQGLSLRAIGAATGVSEATVHDDLAGVQNLTPAPVTGIDGKEYAPSRPAPEPLTEAELQAKERKEAIERAVWRLEGLEVGWVQLETLASLAYRDEVMDALAPSTRQKILEIESIYQKGTR